MNNTEIKVNELIIESIDKLIEKYQKKADKERAKIKQAYITYKGDKYYTENDILDAYGCDCFSSAVCDRLIERLNKAKCGTSETERTESEQIVFELEWRRNALLREIADDKRVKEKQEQTDKRMRELMASGYSYKEAETIIGNEELMRYE